MPLRKIIIMGLVFSGSLTGTLRAETVQDLKSYLKEQLADSPKKIKEVFALSPAEKKALVAVAERATDDSFTFYYGKWADDKLAIACTVVPQEGKEGAMSIGVCFDGAGTIKTVRVLDLVEDHGKKVKELDWLRQFNGKKAGAGFRVGKDVDGISGATRSSEAVSEAVRKASFGFLTYVKKK